MHSLMDGVIVIDRDSRVLYVNAAYTEILGVDRDEVLGRMLKEMEPRARILEVLTTGQPVNRQVSLIRSLGIEVLLTATPIFRGGQVVGAVSVFRNVTEVRRLHRALDRMRRCAHHLERKLRGHEVPANPFVRLMSRNPGFGQALEAASRVAVTPATVMIRGESGVGKELLAEAIHAASPRRAGPFVAINCAAIPEELVESELFGYESGAFTGARREGKPGKFQLAHGGTLFLDEIGDMSLATQAKLLRVLQTGMVERVGGVASEQVDVRVIVATHRDLEAMQAKGSFRRDLYYRLNVVPIYLPPLRERPDDIGLLAEAFLAEYGRMYGRLLTLAPGTEDILCRYPWPGNVRELRHAIEYAAIMTDGGVIEPADLPPTIRDHGRSAALPTTPVPHPADLAEHAERDRILAALQQTRYNKTRAMRLLRMCRATFYQRLHKYGLLPPREG